MAHHQARPGTTFDPTLALATDRIRDRHLEAHGERLAALVPSNAASSLRVRLGNALISLGSTLVTPVETRRPSLVD